MYLALAGDVAGRRILDAGCGVGPPFEALRDRRAVVTGIDKSAGMLQFRERFRVISGQLGTRIEGVERILVAGQEAVAMAGAA